jgi:hypothetical protein
MGAWVVTERKRAGRVELAVRRDLKAMSVADSDGRATLGVLAGVLARAIDNQPAGANPATTAKLVQELRAVMAAMRRDAVDGDDDAGFAADMSTPVRDAPVA